jgi:hypothetical protein
MLFNYVSSQNRFTVVTNQDLIHEEIKRRLSFGNTWYLSVQNLLFSLLLFRNVNIRMWFCVGVKLGL